MGVVDGVAKVAELDERVAVGPGAVQQRVLQLYVAVADAHLVAVVQRQYDLLVEEPAVLLLQAVAARMQAP